MAKQKNILIGGLIAVVFVMTITYAAFASQLTITGTGNITSEWNIHFDKTKIATTDGVVVATKATGATTSPTGTLSYTGDLSVTLTPTLKNPGDKVEFNLTVVNDGNIDAMLETINMPASTNPAIKFTRSGMEEGTKLPANSSKTFTVTVEYDSSVTNQPESTTADISATLTFVQDGGITLDTPTINCDIPSDVLGVGAIHFTPIVTGANGEYTGEIHVSIVDQDNVSYYPTNAGNNTFSFTYPNKTAEYTITISTDKTDLYSASSAVYILKVKFKQLSGGGGGGGAGTTPSK